MKSLLLCAGLLLILAGCKTSEYSPEPPNRPVTVPNENFSGSFTEAPFINPKIIKDLTIMLSGNRDEIMAINLLGSQNSNRYFGDPDIFTNEQKYPYISFATTNIEYGETYITDFGYRFAGKTSSGIYVLMVGDNEGGSGTFVSLLLVKFEYGKTAVCDWDKGKIGSEWENLLIKKMGQIVLGDRFYSPISVKGNSIIIGKDIGPYGYNTNEIVLKIDVRH